MPTETKQAIEWALQQSITTPDGEIYQVSKETKGELVSFVRAYFNNHNIEYSTFSYKDLIPYLDKLSH